MGRLEDTAVRPPEAIEVEDRQGDEKRPGSTVRKSKRHGIEAVKTGKAGPE